MDDEMRFAKWYVPWKAARPDVTPLGWYTYADLEAAFNAGRADQQQQTLDEILERTRALEELLRDRKP